MSEITLYHIGTVCFFLAIVHTFSVRLFQRLAHKYPEGSVGENFFHLLGEVEVVFGIWAAIFFVAYMFFEGSKNALSYLETRNYTEPLFVFVVMTICASKPILSLSEFTIRRIGTLLPFHKNLGFYFATMTLGPILGSFITEPAAMTVTALILLKNFYSQKISEKLKYATIGLLFVNISIGGTLTPYAAPPVLMVAPKWNWDLTFMFTNFGWKAIIAILISSSYISYKFRKEISALSSGAIKQIPVINVPIWVSVFHLTLLSLVIVSAHHIVLFIGIFLFYLGFASVTREYQDSPKIRESLLVGFFLGGLVILGGQQNWWLEPILGQLSSLSMYLGSMFLTAFTDNAAITYLGSQVSHLSDFSKYALVSGSVAGGGLTVIANAPNPAGYSMLNSSFGENGISPLALFRSALIPTLVAATCFWFL